MYHLLLLVVIGPHSKTHQLLISDITTINLYRLSLHINLIRKIHFVCCVNKQRHEKKSNG